MTRPTVAQAEAWRPDSLRLAADAWDAAAVDLRARVDAVARGIDGSHDFWTGSAAEAARHRGGTISAGGAAATRCLITAAVAARDGVEQLASARADVLDLVAAARAEGFVVAADGSVAVGDPRPLAVAVSGGSAAVARDVLAVRAGELTRPIMEALDRPGAADDDTAKDIVEALNPPHAPPAPTAPAGAWPVPLADLVSGWSAIGQDRIANQIAAMTPEQRQRLIDEFPKQLGNTRRCAMGHADRRQQSVARMHPDLVQALCSLPCCPAPASVCSPRRHRVSSGIRLSTSFRSPLS